MRLSWLFHCPKVSDIISDSTYFLNLILCSRARARDKHTSEASIVTRLPSTLLRKAYGDFFRAQDDQRTQGTRMGTAQREFVCIGAHSPHQQCDSHCSEVAQKIVHANAGKTAAVCDPTFCGQRVRKTNKHAHRVCTFCENNRNR